MSEMTKNSLLCLLLLTKYTLYRLDTLHNGSHDIFNLCLKQGKHHPSFFRTLTKICKTVTTLPRGLSTVSHHIQHIFRQLSINRPQGLNLVDLQVRGHHFTIILSSSQIMKNQAGMRVRVCSSHVFTPSP